MVIPAGHYILASPGYCHTHPEWFGKDAKEFRPERWLQEEQPYQGLDVSKDGTVDYGFGAVSKGARSPYLPFGAGRHRCIGEQFAFCQLGTILVSYLRFMKWTVPSDEPFPQPDYSSMVTLPIHPCHIIWAPRT
jgi:sterol 14-demethylase